MRYLPLTEADRKAMLGVIGAKSVDDLFRDVPDALRLKTPLDLIVRETARPAAVVPLPFIPPNTLRGAKE